MPHKISIDDDYPSQCMAKQYGFVVCCEFTTIYIQICAAIWMVGTSECKHGRGSYLLNWYSEEPSLESLMCLL